MVLNALGVDPQRVGYFTNTLFSFISNFKEKKIYVGQLERCTKFRISISIAMERTMEMVRRQYAR
jgi:hypothetical protein